MADPVSQYDITSSEYFIFIIVGIYTCMYIIVFIIIDCGNYNADTFLEKFPYCLPSMFSALLSVTGVTVVAYLLPVEPEDKQ